MRLCTRQILEKQLQNEKSPQKEKKTKTDRTVARPAAGMYK